MGVQESLADEQADRVIQAMIVGVIGTSVIPTYVNWALTASAMGTGVVGIGLCYGVELTKEEAWQLIKQFFSAAGYWFMGMIVGSRLLSGILTSTGIGYGGAIALDATGSAALAYAIGASAKAYFKGVCNKKQLGEIMRAQFAAAKKDIEAQKNQ